MSKIKVGGLAMIIAGFVLTGWSLREIARNMVPYFANSVANRYTLVADGAYSQNQEKAEPEASPRLRPYLMTGSVGIAGIAAGLWVYKREDYDSDFGSMGVVKVGKKHPNINYTGKPTTQTEKRDDKGRFKIE